MRYLLMTLAIAAFAFVGMQTVPVAFAHPGGLAGDSCHKKKADGGTRHAHFTMKDGSKAEVDCEVFTAISANRGVASEATVKELFVARAEINALQERVDMYRARALEAEANIKHAGNMAASVIRKYENQISATKFDRKKAMTEVAKAGRTLLEAKQVLAVAEARERGAGPPASRDCQRSIRMLVTERETMWLSSSIKLDRDERRIIALSCLSK